MATTAPAMPDEAPGASSRGYAGYVLLLLFLANLLNSVDRSIVNILVEPIRTEFGFTDTQIGAISGLGFALFYGALGIPIARAADRYSRKRILAAGIALWSAMTMLTGLATGFWSMLAARFGVGAGEATCYPTALSLIADYFKSSQRPRAIALFQVGTHGGFIVGAIAAGVVAERHGWRAAFYVLGAPGLLVALIILLTLREPARGRYDTAGALRHDGNWRDVLARLLGDRIFLRLALASTFMSLGAATLANWGAAYMMRSHGLGQSEVGLVLGPTLGMGGAVGTILGGFLGTMLARRSDRLHAPLRLMLWTALPAIPCMILFLLAPTVPLAIVGGVVGGVLTSLHYGPLIATTISRVAPGNRGLASALLVIGQTVIGFGFGPLIAGALSDALHPALGVSALRHAMLLAPMCILIAWSLALSGWRALEREGEEIGLRATASPSAGQIAGDPA